MRVFVTHNPEDLAAYFGRALPMLREVADVVLNPLERDLSTPELIEAAAGCDVIIAHRATPGEVDLFSQRHELLAMFRTAVDISTIDVRAATIHGVLVGHADKSFVPSTAEIALGLLLDVARGISDSSAGYQRHEQPPQRQGFQLRGKTAGIIGHGAIGSYLAGLLEALGLEVLVNDPLLTSGDLPSSRALVSFEDLLAGSDVVFPLAPAIPDTENLIDAEALALMRPGSTLINVSRGELLDDGAVADALDRGHLGGLGMDVGRAPDQRPSPELAARPGVVATPHLGGLTPDNANAQAASSVEQVKALLAGEIPPRVVNADSASRLRAYWDGQ